MSPTKIGEMTIRLLSSVLVNFQYSEVDVLLGLSFSRITTIKAMKLVCREVALAPRVMVSCFVVTSRVANELSSLAWPKSFFSVINMFYMICD